MYVLLRDDLPYEHQGVQIGHATYESARAFPNSDDDTFLVVLAVPDEAALIEAGDRLTRKGLRFVMFDEPDYGIGKSALASEPITSNQKRKVFFPYPKWVPKQLAEVAQ